MSEFISVFSQRVPVSTGHPAFELNQIALLPTAVAEEESPLGFEGKGSASIVVKRASPHALVAAPTDISY